MYYISNQNELYHYGILGQKWGVRRYQNEDGTLTEAGKRRYGVDVSRAKNTQTRKVAEDYYNLSNKEFKKKYYATKNTFARRYNKTDGDTYSLGKKRAEKVNKILQNKDKYAKAAVGIGAGIVATAGIYAFASSPQGRALLSKGKNYIKNYSYNKSYNKIVNAFKTLDKGGVKGYGPGRMNVGSKPSIFSEQYKKDSYRMRKAVVFLRNHGFTGAKWG